MKRPALYKLIPDRNFKPKLDFFKSIGLTDMDIVVVLSSEPSILQSSLEKKLIPCSQALQRALGTDVLRHAKVWCCVSRSNFLRFFEPNVSLLMSHGVPEPSILALFKLNPWMLLISNGWFLEILGRVVKLGFDPGTRNFVEAVRPMAAIGQPTWEQKLGAFKSFGFSTDQIESMFKQLPMIMLSSAKKIKKLINFLFNKLDMEPSDV